MTGENRKPANFASPGGKKVSDYLPHDGGRFNGKGAGSAAGTDKCSTSKDIVGKPEHWCVFISLATCFRRVGVSSNRSSVHPEC